MCVIIKARQGRMVMICLDSQAAIGLIGAPRITSQLVLECRKELDLLSIR